ncbi:cytochrome b5-like [Chrysoperla carnea]|uniref:cytochrome b5-like n=1 Tax=Chrysoperla carnea TaxID=189513 RepID=UPI001D0825AA|nr:cytochrome b5-like [Chrysoperla carnea]
MTVSDVKLYSLKEVAEHNGENGSEIWIIIKDMVYNVTPYLDDHPGGGDLITEWAGKDATKAYNDFGHSGDADRMLKKYKIGELIDEDRKSKKKTKIQKPAKDEKPKDEKPKIIEKQPNNTTNSMNSSATAKAKAKEAEASAGFEKDRGFVYYVTCGCLSS